MDLFRFLVTERALVLALRDAGLTVPWNAAAIIAAECDRLAEMMPVEEERAVSSERSERSDTDVERLLEPEAIIKYEWIVLLGECSCDLPPGLGCCDEFLNNTPANAPGGEGCLSGTCASGPISGEGKRGSWNPSRTTGSLNNASARKSVAVDERVVGAGSCPCSTDGSG